MTEAQPSRGAQFGIEVGQCATKRLPGGQTLKESHRFDLGDHDRAFLMVSMLRITEAELAQRVEALKNGLAADSPPCHHSCGR